MPAKKKVESPVEPVEAAAPPVEPAAPLAPAAPAPQSAPVPPQQIGPGDERTWSLLAHLSVLLNLVTGFAGPVAALVIYLVYKDRSRLIAYHALQSMLFQLIWWGGGGILIGVMWAIVGALSAILIGVVFIPVAIILTFALALMPLGALVYGVVGAVQVSQGQDFKYWLVGDWVRGALTGA